MENEQHPDTFQPTENRYPAGKLRFDRVRSAQRIYFNGQRIFETLLSANVADDVSVGYRRLNGM